MRLENNAPKLKEYAENFFQDYKKRSQPQWWLQMSWYYLLLEAAIKQEKKNATKS